MEDRGRELRPCGWDILGRSRSGADGHFARAGDEAVTILVGDVGGTHARFALVDVDADPWRIEKRLSLDEDFRSFADAIRAGIERLGAKPEAASIAVAGPVSKGAVTFT